MLSPDECREQAASFVKLASQAYDLALKDRLLETAQGWMRLAADLAKLDSRPKAIPDAM
jgi:hypothetical protein